MNYSLVLYFLPVVLGVIAYIRNSLDLSGSICGIVLGYIFLTLGLEWFSLLLWFFVLGVIVTKIGYERKKKMGLHQKTRGIGNVLGNSLAGLLFALLGSPYGAIAAFSTATADTASSEIGLLSKRKPVSILTGKVVEPGYDGGITVLGLSAMILFAFIFSLVAFLFWDWSVFWIGLMGGIFGTMLDSVLGDAFESKGLWGNDTTNLLSTLGAGLLAFALQLLILG